MDLFEDFYKNTFPQAYRYLYIRINNASYIEDILHDSYLVVYEKYKEKINNVEAEKILFGVIHKKYIDYIRSKYKEYENIEYIENVSEDNPIVISNLDLSTLEERLKDYIYKLEKKYPKLMVVLRMRLLDKMSRKEVAEVLGISEDNVHTYQKRAIAIIKKLLQMKKNDENK